MTFLKGVHKRRLIAKETSIANCEVLDKKHRIAVEGIFVGIIIKEGVNGVNRLATKGKKSLPTTDKTRKKLPTTDRKNVNRLPTWTDIIYIFFQKEEYFFYLSRK